MHDRQRLLQEGQPDRQHDAAAARRRRLGAGDLARPRHGLGGLPRLQDPAGRGQSSDARQPGDGRELRGRSPARSRSATATAAATRPRDAYASHYNHPGIAITASTGDNGYGVVVPGAPRRTSSRSAAPSLTELASARGWTESAWSGAGSRLLRVQRQAALPDATPAARKRAIADVSAVADPNTGVAVYDTYAYQGSRAGWSSAAPARRRRSSPASTRPGPATRRVAAAAYTWGHADRAQRRDLGLQRHLPHDAVVQRGGGWDGPTGLGTPNGAGAF